MYVATVPLMSMLSVSTWQIEVLFSAGVAIFAHISLKISEEIFLKTTFFQEHAKAKRIRNSVILKLP